MKYYPAFLDLRDRLVLVVGGGQVAERKAAQLLDAGAQLRIVSPDLTPRLTRLVQAGRISYRQGAFDESDLDGAWLVIGATDGPQVNTRVARAAEERHLFCNIVDVPSLCSSVAPALIARGDVLVAISTGGSSPALAQRLKREIAAWIGEEYSQLAELMRRWRQSVMEQVPHQPKRAELFHQLVESDILDLLRAGQPSAAEARAAELIEQAAAPPDVMSSVSEGRSV